MSLTAEPTGPNYKNLTTVQKEIAYSRILAAAVNHADVSLEKATLATGFQCSPSALDGVHAQFTKDANAVSLASGTDCYGEGLNALRLAVRGARTRALPSDEHPPMLDGLENLLTSFEPIASKRGAEIVFKYLVPERFRSTHQFGERDEAPKYIDVADAHFDFPAKRIWRGHWKLTLVEKLRDVSTARRSQMRVICFAGTDPTLELSIYKELGFAPENVIAIESNDRAAALLRANLQKLGGWYEGVTVVEKDLEAFLKRHPADFDVASLDYHGCYGLNKRRIAAILPLADDAAVLVNLETGREKEDAKELMEEMVASASIRKLHPELCFTSARLDGGISSVLAAVTSDDEKVTFAEARNELIDWDLMSNMGHANWRPPTRLAESVMQVRDLADELISRELGIRRASPFQIDEYVVGSLESLVKSAVTAAGDGWVAAGQVDAVSAMFRFALRGTPLLHKMSRFLYRSAASQANQAYYSTFASVKRGNYDSDTLEFLVESVKLSIERRLQGNRLPTGFTCRELGYDRKTSIEIIDKSISRSDHSLSKADLRLLKRQQPDELKYFSTIAWFETRPLRAPQILMDGPMIPTVVFHADVLRLNAIVGDSPLCDAAYMRTAQKRTVISG